MNSKNILRSTFSLVLPIGLLMLLFTKWNNITDYVSFQDYPKQKGAHVFGIGDTTDYQPIHDYNIEWITLIPWAFQDDYNSPLVKHNNGDSVQILRYDSSWVKRIARVHDAGFKVFVKPHVWIDNPTDGKWRSDIFPTNDENWQLWKESYHSFVLRYAKIAALAKAEMFCIGTEFSLLSVEKPAYWEELITEIKTIYNGKITYASNWYEEYERITFWDKLDYIGIQAYFPLAENTNPTVVQIEMGWDAHLPSLTSIHKKHNRKILFTEMGYKSIADGAIKPWEWVENSTDLDNTFSEETQANCYQAFFNKVWGEDWFAGVHIWSMRIDNRAYPTKLNLDFTPKGKAAEKIITKGFK